jgi:hypothetical protein
MRWVTWATASVATLLLATPAPAQDRAPNVTLAWLAPSECPTEAAVRGELRAILSDSTAPGRVDAQAVVRRAGDRWHVDIDIRSEQGSGKRSFDAASCSELGSAVALIVALAFDPSRRPLAAEPNADGGAAVAPPAPPAPPEPPPPAPAAVAGDRSRLRLVVAAGGAVDVGALPSAGAGGVIAIGVALGRARLEARGAIFGSQRQTDAAQPSQGVELAALMGGGRGCYALLVTERALAGPCVGLEVERLAGAGFGGQATFSGDGTWLSVNAGLLGTFPLASFFALRAGAELLTPLSRPTFVVLAPDGSVAGSLHRPSSVGARFELGGELRFF